MNARLDDHRIATRHRSLKGGKAILSASTMTDCIIRDLSDTGARLEFGGMIPLPPQFKLRIVSTGETIPVELEWQRGLAAGIHFRN